MILVGNCVKAPSFCFECFNGHPWLPTTWVSWGCRAVIDLGATTDETVALPIHVYASLVSLASNQSKETKMIFAFMDESGHPHPNDQSTRPVLVTVCLDAGYLRTVNTEVFRLKKRLLQRDSFDFEMKAKKLITPATFRNRPDKREFVESFFELMRNLEVTIFAQIMERPASPPPTSEDFLPMQFRHQLYRVNRYLELHRPDDLAAIMFDGDGSQFGGLAIRFSNWLYRSAGGQSLTRLADSPFFVDSKVTPGIQLADMVASVVRQYEERRLFTGMPEGDSFGSAIARYYKIVEEKTADLEAPQGDFTWYGFNRMPERDHYQVASGSAPPS